MAELSVPPVGTDVVEPILSIAPSNESLPVKLSARVVVCNGRVFKSVNNIFHQDYLINHLVYIRNRRYEDCYGHWKDSSSQS